VEGTQKEKKDAKGKKDDGGRDFPEILGLSEGDAEKVRKREKDRGEKGK